MPGESNLAGWLGSRGYEDLRLPNTRIYFDGCNVADTTGDCAFGPCPKGASDGPSFLAEFGKIFLRKCGGRVTGSTSAGLANPFGYHVYHLWGETVVVFVYKGGSRLRLARGKELSTPVGRWNVTVSYGDSYVYDFEPDGNVAWRVDKLFGAKPAKEHGRRIRAFLR